MNHLHFPWLELCVATPLLGAVCVVFRRDRELQRQWSIFFSGFALLCAVGAWLDFDALGVAVADDPGSLLSRWTGRELLFVDELSAPLLPLTALLHLLTALVTLRIKALRFSFARNLVAESIVLATLSCREPWAICALLSASAVPKLLELRSRGKSMRAFALHMGLMVALLAVGCGLTVWPGQRAELAWLPAVPWTLAVLIRSGIAPFHCWLTDLFEHATFGRALLFVTPMMGAYAAIRLVLPIAPDWALRSLGIVSLFTAVYASGMALVQQEARRFFCYVFLSHSALVFVGLQTVSQLGLTGALCVWISVALSLAGFGLTLRALEARHGRLSLTRYHGAYADTPLLAVCFLVTGMASVGFPGTFGFIGSELLVDAAVESYPYIGVAVLLAAALNGIAILKAYFRLFTGTRVVASVPLHVSGREKVAVLTLVALIIGGGVYPQPGVASRYRAAESILQRRATNVAAAREPQAGRSARSSPASGTSGARREPPAPPDQVRRGKANGNGGGDAP